MCVNDAADNTWDDDNFRYTLFIAEPSGDVSYKKQILFLTLDTGFKDKHYLRS